MCGKKGKITSLHETFSGKPPTLDTNSDTASQCAWCVHVCFYMCVWAGWCVRRENSRSAAPGDVVKHHPPTPRMGRGEARYLWAQTRMYVLRHLVFQQRCAAACDCHLTIQPAGVNAAPLSVNTCHRTECGTQSGGTVSVALMPQVWPQLCDGSVSGGTGSHL